LFVLFGTLVNDPHSPAEGKYAQGEHSPDPLCFLGYISTLSGVIVIEGCPGSGGGSMTNWSAQERLFVSMRISADPDFFAILAIVITKKPVLCRAGRLAG